MRELISGVWKDYALYYSPRGKLVRRTMKDGPKCTRLPFRSYKLLRRRKRQNWRRR